MGFAPSRLGVCGLEILDKKSRDRKEKEQRHRIKLGGQIQWILNKSAFIFHMFIYLNPKGRKNAKNALT